MSRPVLTAILLEDLHRQGLEFHLPKNAIITPAARDWLKEHPVPVTWVETDNGIENLVVVMDPSLPEMRTMRTILDRQGGLKKVIEPVGGLKGIAEATRQLCKEIARKQAGKGIIFAVDGAVPVCVANKHNGIRAAMGIDVPMVEEACRELGINVLVIEYQTQTTYRMKQMIDRLITNGAGGRPETLEAIELIEQGGGRADR